jgi:hypothetical protein
MPKHILEKNFRPIVTGTTQGVKTFEIQDNVNGPVDLTDAVITIQLKTYIGGPVEHEFSTTNGKLEIDANPFLGIFRMKRQIIDLKPYRYLYDIQIHLPDETQLTPMRGYYTVEAEVTIETS